MVENNIKKLTLQSNVSNTTLCVLEALYGLPLVLIWKILAFTRSYYLHCLPAFATTAALSNSTSLIFKTVNMATTPVSNDSEEHMKGINQADEEQKYVLQAGWKVLFCFTTKKHVPVFSAAILSATIAAATLPAFSIIYGLIFEAYSEFGAGTLDRSQLLGKVTSYCLILTGVASFNWIANSIYFFLFLAFGELQAKSARKKVFGAIIQKDMAWYDTRENGIAAFLPTIQM